MGNANVNDMSVEVFAEPVNATLSQDSTATTGIIDATFDVSSGRGEEQEPVNAIINQTFDASNQKSQNNSQDNDQFIEAEIVEKPQEVVNNIVEILKSVEKVTDKLPSPIPAPRAINKEMLIGADEGDSKTRSTRTKQKLLPEESDSQKVEFSKTNSDAKRNTRTSSKNPNGYDESAPPTRSTRTRQKNLPSTDDDKTASETECVEDARPIRSTRTRQKQLAVSNSESALTNRSTSKLMGGYTGSPVKDRVKVFEEAMRDSAGLRSARKSRRKSSIQVSLEKVSAARKVSVSDVIAEQEPNIVKKGPVIRKSPGVSSNTNLNNSRAPAGKVVRPGRKVL